MPLNMLPPYHPPMLPHMVKKKQNSSDGNRDVNLRPKQQLQNQNQIMKFEEDSINNSLDNNSQISVVQNTVGTDSLTQNTVLDHNTRLQTNVNHSQPLRLRMAGLTMGAPNEQSVPEPEQEIPTPNDNHLSLQQPESTIFDECATGCDQIQNCCDRNQQLPGEEHRPTTVTGAAYQRRILPGTQSISQQEYQNLNQFQLQEIDNSDSISTDGTRHPHGVTPENLEPETNVIRPSEQELEENNAIVSGPGSLNGTSTLLQDNTRQSSHSHRQQQRHLRLAADTYSMNIVPSHHGQLQHPKMPLFDPILDAELDDIQTHQDYNEVHKKQEQEEVQLLKRSQERRRHQPDSQDPRQSEVGMKNANFIKAAYMKRDHFDHEQLNGHAQKGYFNHLKHEFEEGLGIKKHEGNRTEYHQGERSKKKGKKKETLKKTGSTNLNDSDLDSDSDRVSSSSNTNSYSEILDLTDALKGSNFTKSYSCQKCMSLDEGICGGEGFDSSLTSGTGTLTREQIRIRIWKSHLSKKAKRVYEHDIRNRTCCEYLCSGFSV